MHTCASRPLTLLLALGLLTLPLAACSDADETDRGERDLGMMPSDEADSGSAEPDADMGGDDASMTQDMEAPDQDVAPDQGDPMPAMARIEVAPRVTVRGESGMTQRVILTISNAGDAPLELSQLNLSGMREGFEVLLAGASLEQDTPFTAQTIAAGAQLQLALHYTRSAQTVGVEQATLTLATDVEGSRFVDVTLEGTGPLCLEFLEQGRALSKLDFGVVRAGESETRDLKVSNCTGAPVSIDEVVLHTTPNLSLSGAPMPGGVALEAEGELALSLTYSPSEEELLAATLSVVSEEEMRTLAIVGSGTTRDCVDVAFEARPANTTTWDTSPVQSISPYVQQELRVMLQKPGMATQVNADLITWALVQKPSTSSASVLLPAAQNPKFTADILGTYTIEASIDVAALGEETCDDAPRLTFEASPNTMGYYIELTWSTPTDMNEQDDFGTDLDLHYKRSTDPWDDVGDVFWRNPTQDWGVSNDTSDDPALVLDDIDGQGPEVIVHPQPELDGLYDIGVYSYNDNGFGPSYATVSVYIDGALSFQARDKFMQSEDVFWHVATVQRSRQPEPVVSEDVVTSGFPQ